ncbi:3-hydroxyacyl-CoA dehydrogenase, NAD binding domain protein, partial [Ostertagia ostertagi]
MDLANVSDEVKSYIMSAQQKASQWHLPNGGSWQNSKAAPVKTAAVIGGVLDLSYPQQLYDKSLEVCRRELKTTYAREKKLGRLSSLQCEKLEKGIHLTTDLNSLKNCDLVIEAVFEKMKLKTELFTKLSQICKPTTIFATNTSSLNIDEMSTALQKPERLVGMHFFNPAHIIRMVEVVFGKHTSAEAVATAFSVCSQMKKLPVLVGNCP